MYYFFTKQNYIVSFCNSRDDIGRNAVDAFRVNVIHARQQVTRINVINARHQVTMVNVINVNQKVNVANVKQQVNVIHVSETGNRSTKLIQMTEHTPDFHRISAIRKISGRYLPSGLRVSTGRKRSMLGRRLVSMAI